MPLCAAGLCPQTGENLGLQSFRRLNPVASLPFMRKVAMPWALTQPCRFSPVFCRGSSADGRRSIHTNVCILMDVIPSRTMPICCDDILKYLWVNFNRHGTMRAAICPRKTQGPLRESRVGKGISAQASHRTVREALTSYGSCYPISALPPIANDRTCLHSVPVVPYT